MEIFSGDITLSFIGNALMSFLAILLIIGAPIKERREEKTYWTLFWFSVLSRYLFSHTIFKGAEIPLNFINFPIDVLGSMSLWVLLFCYYWHPRLKRKKVIWWSIIWNGLPYAYFLVVYYFLTLEFDTIFFTYQVIISIECISGLIIFILIGWSMREHSITNTMIFISYGALCLAGMLHYLGVIKDSDNKVFELAILAKIALITAVYKNWGIGKN